MNSLYCPKSGILDFASAGCKLIFDSRRACTARYFVSLHFMGRLSKLAGRFWWNKSERTKCWKRTFWKMWKFRKCRSKFRILWKFYFVFSKNFFLEIFKIDFLHDEKIFFTQNFLSFLIYISTNATNHLEHSVSTLHSRISRNAKKTCFPTN